MPSDQNEELTQEIARLTSESQNPQTENLDMLSTTDILQKINQEDASVAKSVANAIPDIAKAVDAIVGSFQQGGRLIYMGAGTSGRLGVLDAAECPPTFSVSHEMVVACIAGGNQAMFKAVEGAEDSSSLAIDDLQKLKVNSRDTVVGIAASGRTPYAISAVNYAASVGAATAGISCNANSALLDAAQIGICALVGPEVISGSTRMKSGTAQKLILNMLTTASMVKIGKVYGNLMVDVKATNEKLKARATNMVVQITDCQESEAKTALLAANYNVKLAVLMLLKNIHVELANALLTRANGVLRTALTIQEK